MSKPVGRRLRKAARVILLDKTGRVLLFRYTAPGFDPFWILPGGACEANEDFAQAAARELQEETGILASPAHTGIVRQAEYEYFGEPVSSIEHFFCHVTASAIIDTSGHTPLERDVMQSHRWFLSEEVGDWNETIYPRDMANLMRRFRAAPPQDCLL